MFDDEETKRQKAILAENEREYAEQQKELAAEKKRKADKAAEKVGATLAMATLPAMTLPDTNDLRALAMAAHGPMTKKILLMAYQSDNLVHVLNTWDKITDRLIGKPEQSVSAKVEVVRPEKSLEEVARMIAFSMRSAKEHGAVIDVTPTEVL